MESNTRRVEKATDDLKQDHRVIERVLGVVDSLTKTPGGSPLELWGKAIDFIRNFADKYHHLKEEKVFFPALQNHGIPREGGPVGVMLMEHEEGRGYVRAMAAALAECGKGQDSTREALVGNARAYVRLLREHIMKEDEILFQMADDVLTPKDQEQILRQFEEHEERELGRGVREKYIGIAEELENAVA